MMIIQHPILDVVGLRCDRILAQEYWHGGILAEELNVMWLVLSDGLCHKIHFDSGVLFWQTIATLPICDTNSSDAFHYPYRDLSTRFPVRGLTIESVQPINGPPAELRFRFSGGRTLILREGADCMHLSYEE